MFVNFIKVPFVSAFDLFAYAENMALGIFPSGEYIEAKIAIDNFESYLTGFRRFFSGSGYWLTSGSAQNLTSCFGDNFELYPTGGISGNALNGNFIYQGYSTEYGTRTGNLFLSFDLMSDNFGTYPTGTIEGNAFNKNKSVDSYTSTVGSVTGNANFLSNFVNDSFVSYPTGSSYEGEWLTLGLNRISYSYFGTSGSTYRPGQAGTWLPNSGSLSGFFTNFYSTIVPAVINSGVATNTGQYFQYPHNSAFNIGDFTCEFWVYRNGDWTQENSRFVDKGWNGGFALDRYITTDLVQAEINGELYYTTNIKLSPNLWTHFAWVRQGSTIYTYSGGAAYGESQACDSSILSGSYPFTFGANGSTAPYGEFFNGTLNEIRFWNYARSSGDIAANYNQQVSPSSPGLLLYLSI